MLRSARLAQLRLLHPLRRLLRSDPWAHSLRSPLLLPLDLWARSDLWLQLHPDHLFE